MVKINKAERDFLESKGFKMGEHIHHTYSHNKHYYVTESYKVMNALNKYRQSVVSYTRSVGGVKDYGN